MTGILLNSKVKIIMCNFKSENRLKTEIRLTIFVGSSETFYRTIRLPKVKMCNGQQHKVHVLRHLTKGKHLPDITTWHTTL